MSSLIVNKRSQARIERALQGLRDDVPGNNVCADCGVRDPGWASYSLGIFLCVRCASSHRALGTHISKVKSISMDLWTTEQVDVIKQIGNVASNRLYNPRNVRPVVPMDPDMVDAAMTRYIREKYQRKSLNEGAQATTHNTSSNTSIEDQPPPLPPKPVGQFVLGGRSASSTFPLSRKDQSLPQIPSGPEQSAFGASPSIQVASALRGRRGSLNSKLTLLQNMGFQNANRNAAVLRGLNENLEKTIEALSRLGDGPRPSIMGQSAQQVPQAYPVANPQATAGQQELNAQFGHVLLATNDTPNPYIGSMQHQRVHTFPLEQQMQSMQISSYPQISQPSNWYDVQQTFPAHATLTPPISPPPTQFAPAPTPLTQQVTPISATNTGNPTDTNPFLRMTRAQTFSTAHDMYGARQPSPALSMAAYDQQVPQPFYSTMSDSPGQTMYQLPQEMAANVLPANQPRGHNQGPSQPQSQPWYEQSQVQNLPSMEYGTTAQPHYPSFNGYGVQIQDQSFSHYQQPGPSLPPARMAKDNILALFNQVSQHPQSTPTTILTQADDNSTPDQSPAKPPIPSARRSVTMPITTNVVSGTAGKPNRNPFATHVNAGTPGAPPMVTGHIRKESAEFSNSTNGRHSPDAFASLSSRFA